MKKKVFDNRSELDIQLAKDILNSISELKKSQKEVNILFSGGSTPQGLLLILAESKFDWHGVSVSLVDDRIVEESSNFSNARMIKTIFLNKISGNKPKFLPLVRDTKDLSFNMDSLIENIPATKKPDIVVLGMGTDGHFASLFPNDPASSVGLQDDQDQHLIYTTAPSEPKNRISFTWPYLRKADKVFLHITGQEKLEIINNGANRSLELPIDKVLSDNHPNSSIYWAP